MEIYRCRFLLFLVIVTPCIKGFGCNFLCWHFHHHHLGLLHIHITSSRVTATLKDDSAFRYLFKQGLLPLVHIAFVLPSYSVIVVLHKQRTYSFLLFFAAFVVFVVSYWLISVEHIYENYKPSPFVREASITRIGHNNIRTEAFEVMCVGLFQAR